MRPAELPILDLVGPPRARGRAHGSAHARAIRHFADERVRLAGDPIWSGRALDRDGVLELADACWDAHRAYAPELAEETVGMAEATGLSAAELIVVGGFTDFVDAVHGSGGADLTAPAPHAALNCTAFLVPASRATHGAAVFAQTWDMHETATAHVLMLDGRPDGDPRFLAFTTAGALGMIGMNEHGVTVGINNLVGADGRPGVTWPFVVRQALRQRSFDDALACILEAPLAGAHNYLLLDAEGRGANVEAMATRAEVTRLDGRAIAHTNHVLHEANRPLERPKDPVGLASSHARQERAERLLDRDGLGVEEAMEITRDGQAICYRGVPPKYVATCGAVVARPATRELWALRGLPSEQAYRRWTLA